MKFKFIGLILIFVLLLSNLSLSRGVDSDGDGVLDEYDNCPNTNPDEGLPIILRNPEFLGCSCSQIFEIMKEKYCKDVYCYPGRPLEIRDRDFSSRPNPCPPPRCEEDVLFEYVLVDKIRCHRGEELPYECEEIITENSDFCINQVIEESFVEEQRFKERDMFDLLVFSYLKGSDFVEILNMKDKEELIKINDDVLKKISVERNIVFSERTINNKEVIVADVSINVKPKDYVFVEDFVFIERIIGDLTNKNLVISGEDFFDDENQLIVWNVNSLKKEIVFSYRVTHGDGLDFEFVVQGETKSSLFNNLLLPLILIIGVLSIIIYFIFSIREKSEVFKK